VRVNKTQTLVRLQTLLERIRARSKNRRPAPVAGPAVAGAVGAVDGHLVASESVPVALEPVTPPHVDTLRPGPLPTMTPGLQDADDREIESEIAIDIDVSDAGQADGVEDASVEAVAVPAGSDSAERLVVAESPSSAPPEALAVEAAAPPREPPPSTLESVGEFEPELPTDAIDSVDEPAPASSRRPVATASENHLTLAFGSDEPRPPRHTPPPESGRLPSPVGGAFEDDGDVGDVRIDPPGRRSPTELEPEATRAKLEAAAGVADVIGQAQRFSPATFLMLLDASLEL
jgi:hypothetical protein